MAKLTIDLSGIKGLGLRYYGNKPYTASSPNLKYYGFEGEMAEGIFNPISALGYMSPANNTTKAVTGTTNFLLTSAVISPSRIATASTDAIFFADEAVTGTTGKIMNLDTAIDTSLDQAYEIPTFDASQYSKSEDLILYSISSTPKIFFTRTNTTTKTAAGKNAIGIADVDFSSPDPDWSTNVPVGQSATIFARGVYSRLVFVLADNGFLYVLDGRRVHKIDGTDTGGTDGTITEEVLRFIAGTVLVDGIDLRGKMYLGLHLLSNFDTKTNSIDTKTMNMFVGIYVWNRSSTSAAMQDFIPISGAKEIKSLHKLQGVPVCFTMSTDGYTQLRMWNGTEFKVVQTLGSNAYPAYRRHSVHEGGENIIWLGNDGKIYSYGKFENGLENALYILGDMSTHVTNGQTYSGSGVFIAANATETVTSGNQAQPLAFYLSFTDTGGNHMKKWYPYSTETVASVEQKGHQGDVYTLVKYLPDMSTAKYVDIRCAPTGTGTETIATIKYYFNGSASVGMTKAITKDQASRGYVRHELNKPYINAIQMEIEFSTTNTLGSGNDFRPSIAVLDYQATTTKG